jgi:alginate O-acetyltransferase complex protein AlgI
MVFNSFAFLLFFPLVSVIYFLIPHKYRWVHLLTASCFFYCYFVPQYIFVLLFIIVIDYCAGIAIENSAGKRRKQWLWLSIISNCLLLFVFKYFNFFNSNFSTIAGIFDLNYPDRLINLILPIGLSFHTFQSLSYIIEVYRGNQKAERHLGIYSLYVMFFPQLVAGPIERPQNMLHQFHERHLFNYNDVAIGLKKIVWGLFKKVVIADRLAIFVDLVYNDGNHRQNGSALIAATIFFAFQIYCDFSGYSDIAIGSARVLGFKFMTNFKRPYLAQSVSEFWQRWHISLSTWFRDYVYIPLGGNRVTSPRRYFNLFITFLISGLWHGANWTYVFWGALNGVLVVSQQLFNGSLNKVQSAVKSAGSNRAIKGVNILSTFTLICTTWVFFRARSLDEALDFFYQMLFNHGDVFIGDNKTTIYSCGFILLLVVVELFEEYGFLNGFSLFNNSNTFIRRCSYVTAVMIILLFGVLDNSQFIYFQF